MLYEYFFKKSQRKKKRKKGNGGGGWFMKYCFVLTILTKTVQFWLVFIQSDRSNYHKGETLEKWLKHKSICKPLLLLGLYISRILLTSNPRKYLLLMYLDFLFSFFQSNQVHSSRVIKWGYFFCGWWWSYRGLTIFGNISKLVHALCLILWPTLVWGQMYTRIIKKEKKKWERTSHLQLLS